MALQDLSILADLNEPQRRAVTHRDGPLLVLAGPGSGKTRVITRRAAQLVASGVPARNILALTFTNKAADEMRRRIRVLGAGEGMWVYTFHALGARLLHEFGPLARVEPSFTIYDEADRLRLIKTAMQACEVGEHLIQPQAVQADISRAKNRLQTPEQYDIGSGFVEDRTVRRVYAAYEKLLEKHNAVDFDDLLMRVAIVLRDHPEIVERLNIRFRYLLIDEYQDTNHAQYLIADYLSQQHENICATGDPDQSIYAWRGADLGNILDFERDHPDAVVVRLEQNYRSTGNILRVASRLIAANHKRKVKDLWTENEPGGPVRVWSFAEGRDEAERIAATIAEQCADERAYGDFAIVYRINAVSRGLEESLRSRGIPYRIARGLEFYNRKEIKDVVAYLRVLVNPADALALLRIINTPARGIGATTLGRLREIAAERGLALIDVVARAREFPKLKTAVRKLAAFTDLLERLRPCVERRVSDAVGDCLRLSGLEASLEEERESGGEDRLANVQELVSAAVRFEEETVEPTLAEFLERVSLVSDQDRVDETAGCVTLMTLHAAKGLEFPVVFIVGLEQGLLPHERSLKQGSRQDGSLEEERRLCFVGITRAKRMLVLSHAAERILRGSWVPRCASQFLAEIDPEAVQCESFRPAARRAPLRPRAAQEPDEDGFVRLDDQLPPNERPRERRPGRPGVFGTIESDAEPDMIELDRGDRDPRAQERSRFADWEPGMFVTHEKYGPGQVVWIRPGGGETRASVRFPTYGEKTFILELSPLSKLERGRKG